MDEIAEKDGREPEPSLGDVVEGAVRKIVSAVVIAGAAIALAIYARPAPPRYQAFATDNGIVRVDMRTGTVIACETGRCMTLLRRGQRLAPNPVLFEHRHRNKHIIPQLSVKHSFG